MKARVKATGEIIEINESSTIYDARLCHVYNASELENIPDIDSDYWTRLEHQATIAAMQGLCANYTEFTKDNDGTLSNTEMIAENAKLIAHALVEKLKEKEERK